MSDGRPAVFLDRDGVLNEVLMRDGAPVSPLELGAFRLVPDIDTVNRIAASGRLAFIITNQPDIARGNVSAAAVDSMIAVIRDRIHIDDYRVCPHQDADECECRKPRPGMILDLARHWHVDLARSIVVGDTWRDMGAAAAAGCRAILIRRDYNRDVVAEFEVDTLPDAVEAALKIGGAENNGG